MITRDLADTNLHLAHYHWVHVTYKNNTSGRERERVNSQTKLSYPESRYLNTSWGAEGLSRIKSFPNCPGRGRVNSTQVGNCPGKNWKSPSITVWTDLLHDRIPGIVLYYARLFESPELYWSFDELYVEMKH